MIRFIIIIAFWLGVFNFTFPNEMYRTPRSWNSVLESRKGGYRSNLLDSLPDLYFSFKNSDTFCLRDYHNNPNIPDEYYTIECCNQGESIQSASAISIYILDTLPSAGMPLVMDSSILNAVEWPSGECLKFEFLGPRIGHPRFQFPHQYDHTYYYALNIHRDIDTWSFPESITEGDYSNNIDSFYIRPRAQPLQLPKDTLICPGDSIFIDAGSGYKRYLWSDSSSNQRTSVHDKGVYWVEVRATCNERLRDSIKVDFLPFDYEKPSFNIDCERITVVAKLKTNSSLNYLWSNGSDESITYFFHSDSVWLEVNDGVCSTLDYYALPTLPDLHNLPRFQNDTVDTGGLVEYYLDLDPLIWDVKWMPEERITCDTCFKTMIYPSSGEEDLQVILTHSSGCHYENSFRLYWNKIGDLWTPNAFSPNGDGHNDDWRIYPKDENILFLMGAIYNRWGNKVKLWNEVDQISWDGMFNGKVLDSGVYLYWLQYKSTDGELRTIYGDINLFR